MARKRFIPGQRWHRSADGKARVCKATVRTCPLEHFSSEEDAASPRQRIDSSSVSTNTLDFRTQVGESPEASNLSSDTYSLRETAKRAEEKTQGDRRAMSTLLGSIEVTLPRGNRVLLKRETFDYDEESHHPTPRYLVRFEGADNTYFEETVELTNPLSAALLTRRVNDAFTQTEDTTLYMTPEEQHRVADLLDATMQRITEVEVMASGATYAKQRYGLSIFSESDPGVHTLTTKYSNSALRAQDIREALTLQAQEDPAPKEVAIHVSEAFPRGEGAQWTLDRIPEGHWYVGVDTPSGPITEEVESVEQANEVLSRGLHSYGVPAEKIAEYRSFVASMLTEGEAGVKEYEKRMAARQGFPTEASSF